MLNQYAWWKYLIIGLVILTGVIYALPNLFGEDPAVQISPARSTVELGQGLYDRVTNELGTESIPYRSAMLDERQLLVRFPDTETQLKAADELRTLLGRDYTVALNLAPSTPALMRELGLDPMYLGLDLRGGVHFLMEVDMQAVVRQAEEAYVETLRGLLRDARIRYTALGRAPSGGVRVSLRSADDLSRARALIAEELPELQVDSTGQANELRLSMTEQQIEEKRRFALQQNITTLRNRVNELGVAEPIIQQQGSNRIVVQLPGVQDTARAKEILGATATLEFRLVDQDNDPVQAAQSGRAPLNSRLYYDRQDRPILLQRRVILTGDSITDAASGIDQQTGQPAVFITLDGSGARRFEDVTGENIGNLLAVVFIETKTETREVDGEQVRESYTTEEVINVATIRDRLGRRFQITGLDSPQEARNLALLLRAGALAAPITIVEERTVGPSAGQENIDQGFRAAMVAFALVILFMAFYYRLFGLVSDAALIVNLVLIVAVLSMLQATLTLPGIAGIILTIGMAVDANVLIFERIREELKLGNSPQAAIHTGFDRAFGTILDANVTTLIA
ncbi:MAG: protein translocase subunit SecD, partial [Candidatus Competibacterales bacterium]|nr:protein translocase subunit SecD [Candidatus Competibacterales bacterium]